jgi:lipopolysaccharide heptosyltransferase I
LTSKILIVRLGALGDIVHGLPVAAALRERYPDAQIEWLVDRRHAAILDLVPVISRRVAVDSRSAGGMLSAIRALRRQKYDAAVDLQGLVKSAAFARVSGARRVIGFDRAHLREKPASIFYSERCDPGAAAHVVDRNLSLLSAFGITERLRRFPITVPPSNTGVQVADRVARDGRSGYALINPSAAWPNKRWPPERFAEIASWLADAHRLLPVVLWGPGELAIASRIVDTLGGQGMLAPQTGVGDLLALARDARLMLSGDTGPLHLAAAVGTPIVALFGPTDPARNGPWDAADSSLSRFGDCVCHYQRRCRRSRMCIEEISVEDVRGAIDRRLAIAEHHA